MAVSFLPASLASLADCAAKDSTRYTMTGVRIELADGRYSATATDGRFLARVSAPCPEAPGFPALPALDSAPNGATSGIIPTAAFKAAAKGAPKKGPAAGIMAVVMGENVATMATASPDGASLSAPALLEGRFPDVDSVIPKTPPVASVKLDALKLAALLKAIAPFSDAGELPAFTIELRGENKPVVLRASGKDGKEVVALIMPLS